MHDLSQFKHDIAKLRELSLQSPSFDIHVEEQALLQKYGKSRRGRKFQTNDTLADLYGLLVKEEEASSVYTPPELAMELFLKTEEVMKRDPLILDCSSGTGNLARLFLEKGYRTQLMDRDETALSLAKLTCPEAVIRQEDYLMSEGTYDVIIGNPPYKGHKSTTLEETAALKKRFPEVMDNKADLYYAFFAKGHEDLKAGGILSFIVSRYWLEAESAASLRRFILTNFTILYMHDWYGIRPFGAGVDPLLIVLKKQPMRSAMAPISVSEDLQAIEALWAGAIEAGRQGKDEKTGGEDQLSFASGADPGHNMDYEIPVIREDAGAFVISRSQLSESSMKILTGKEQKLREIIEKLTDHRLGELGDFSQGIITGFDRAFIMPIDEALRLGIEEEILVPWAKSSDLKHLDREAAWNELDRLIYADKSAAECPGFMNYIERHRERLSGRREVKNGLRAFHELQWGRDRRTFEAERILFPYKAAGSQFVIAKGIYHSADIYSFRTKLDSAWLIEILNSHLYDSYIKTELKKLGGALYEYYPHRLKKIRIPDPARFPDAGEYLRTIEREL